MSQRTTSAAAIVTATLVASSSGFAFVNNGNKVSTSTSTQLNGLFDGVKEAFAAPALQRSTLDAERETPIDRWMGWSVTREDQVAEVQAAAAVDFVDSMDAENYVAVALEKPMGIIFEENDEEYGGIFVQSLKDGGSAQVEGTLQPGDQLVGVDTTKVSGMPFDDALNTIISSTEETTKLLMFRGAPKQLYGPTGASQEWLDEFISKGGVSASTTA
eukprot:CAMPEP_0194065462 /NCGR_PEP_ID=MMETSP0009_2-20130614/85481_1 /TAXON_ID=210454 /ORGANISM="Grammatophora oceanica, Strain CCMP 410" /LENGTH=215 /DNA_ID=CAMNT_0038718311 /DNA_START=587 /DNA_END=1234 /DNA_ORIENTATION=+